MIPNRQDTAWSVTDVSVDYKRTPEILSKGGVAGIVIAVLIASMLLMTLTFQLGVKKGLKKSTTGADAAGINTNLGPMV